MIVTPSCYVYIMSNQRNGTLYVGSTTNLIQRVWQHKNNIFEGFTSNYDVKRLVYYEVFDEISLMAGRERRLKEWKRAWKIKLIESINPGWEDLYSTLTA